MKDKFFFEHVWELTKRIPEGRVTSYGAIAKALGVGNLSRMVAKAMSECGKASSPVPFYRVVNSTGHLTGDMSAANRRQHLLETEGVKVKDHKVENFKTVFWDPGKEAIE